MAKKLKIKGTVSNLNANRALVICKKNHPEIFDMGGYSNA